MPDLNGIEADLDALAADARDRGNVQEAVRLQMAKLNMDRYRATQAAAEEAAEQELWGDDPNRPPTEVEWHVLANATAAAEHDDANQRLADAQLAGGDAAIRHNALRDSLRTGIAQLLSVPKDHNGPIR